MLPQIKSSRLAALELSAWFQVCSSGGMHPATWLHDLRGVLLDVAAGDAGGWKVLLVSFGVAQIKALTSQSPACPPD